MKQDQIKNIGKIRQDKERRVVDYFMKNSIKNSCTVEPDNNKSTEILWIKSKLKRQEKLFIGVFYGKQESRHCIKELEEEYEVMERFIFNYIKQ